MYIVQGRFQGEAMEACGGKWIKIGENWQNKIYFQNFGPICS